MEAKFGQVELTVSVALRSHSICPRRHLAQCHRRGQFQCFRLFVTHDPKYPVCWAHFHRYRESAN